MPEQFVGMSVELAAEKGIENGERVRVFNNRGSVESWRWSRLALSR